MTSFDELVSRSFVFTSRSLDDLNTVLIDKLQIGSESHLIKSLQMISMQRVILTVGVFSIFEAYLQDRIGGGEGFAEARKRLRSADKGALDDRFGQFIAAINVLKHGRGRSYESLLSQIHTLPFRIKKPDEYFFFEGDVSEIYTLVEVDSVFVQNCVELIHEITRFIEQEI